MWGGSGFCHQRYKPEITVECKFHGKLFHSGCIFEEELVPYNVHVELCS